MPIGIRGFYIVAELREVADELGIDLSKYQGPIIPVIYNINLRDPAGYFLATKFEMRTKDVIYVSNAASYEITKVMNFFNTVVGTINDPMNTALSAFALKSALKGAGSATVLVGGTTTP